MLETLGIDDSFIAGSITTMAIVGWLLVGYACLVLRRARYERAAERGE